MVGSIKLFPFNRQFYDLLGIHVRSEKQGPFLTLRNKIILFFFTVHFVPFAAFFAYDAKSMLDYGFSFFSASLALFGMFIYIATLTDAKNTWLLIENCERFIEKSK